MNEPVAYLNGTWVPLSQARLHVFDLGIVGGITVAEMLRTFGGRPFRVAEHLTRLHQSLELTGLVSPQPVSELPPILQRVADSAVQASGGRECGLIVFVTAGLNPTYVGRTAAANAGGTLCVHSFELPRENWAEKYETGVRLVTPPTPALPAACVDPRIKARSRLHWHLAERAARRLDPQAHALLLDAQGQITETAAANFCAVIHGTIVSPPAGTVLEGVSLGMVRDLAAELNIPFERRPLTLAETLTATECFLTSTPSCLLPVVAINQHPIGDGRPGLVYHQLLAAWSAAVGQDLRTS